MHQINHFLDDSWVQLLTAVAGPAALDLNAENISTKTITGAMSRAGAIANAAEKGDWDTIDQYDHDHSKWRNAYG